MKTENTLENKAKFFALYWGQNVKFWTLNGSENLQKVSHTYMTKAILEGSTLELIPLPQISDEDAINVAKINGLLKSPPYRVNLAIESVRLAFLEVVSWGGLSMPVQMLDYLRSKGYALPFLDLSVDDLVDYGWIKLSDL